MVNRPSPSTPSAEASPDDYFEPGQFEKLVAAEQSILKKALGHPYSGIWTGIALSGGGVRSATFCLGALQALALKGVLPKFDYMSTVSGGGYIGLSLQWFLRKLPAMDREGVPDQGTDRDRFPFGTVHPDPEIGRAHV